MIFGEYVLKAFEIIYHRRVTRIFSGQRSFLGIRTVQSSFTNSTSKKNPAGKNLRFFRLETLKNFILNDKFYLNMTTIRAFFLQIRALFSIFKEREGETSPPPPSSYAHVPRARDEHLYANRIFFFYLLFV